MSKNNNLTVSEARDFHIKRLMELFPDSFINDINELILIPKHNVYFRLDDVETYLDITYKLLAWVSRDATKSQYYNQNWRNIKFYKELQEKLNTYLNKKLSNYEWYYIYQQFGNGVNEETARKLLLIDLDFNKAFELGILDKDDYTSFTNRINNWGFEDWVVGNG